MKVIYDQYNQRIPIKMWLEDIEDGAMEQAKNLSNLPFAVKHIAIMPDSHFGFGMCIGGVFASNGVVIPNAVGKDIGCGMCAVKTPWTAEEINTDIIKKIMGEIRKAIPAGLGQQHKDKQNSTLMPFIGNMNAKTWEEEYPICAREYIKALYQVGTLGSGNHFLELQKDSDNNIWIMIHSGSRNIGSQVADYYNKLAKNLNKRWYSEVPEKYDLAFFPLDTDEGQSYMKEMQYCVDFALCNRKLMMNRIIDIFENMMKDKKVDKDKTINIAHNYASMENHFGENVLIHRKGATLARENTIGIIPGSQGTKSYIVKGKGNPDSFMSCSHGAGRVMGRKEAIRSLNLEEEQKKLNDQGIIHSIRNAKDLDEAAGAYKPIDIVMKNQQDLVEILVELSPLAVIKG